MRYYIVSIFILISLSSQMSVYSKTDQGNSGLMYTYSARTIPKGHLDIYLGTRYFGKIASFGGQNKAYTLWSVRGITSVQYGAGKHVEVMFSPVFYQDTNKGGSGFSKESVNFPDDMFLGMKIGSFSKLESPFQFGGLIQVRIPTARTHNIIYEAYSAGRVEVALMGLVSYFSNVNFPSERWSAHGNLCYLNHNDVGSELTDHEDDASPQSMSSELVANAGVRYPFGTFDFSGEISARYFMTRPPETAYTREYASYMTLGVYYMPYRFLTLEMGFDLRLFSGKDLTEYTTDGTTHLSPPPTSQFPNYPAWRGQLGMRIAILPRSLYKSDEALLKRQARDRQTILQKMLHEQKDTEDAEEELSRIRAERKKVEEELERLRQLLEDESDK